MLLTTSFSHIVVFLMRYVSDLHGNNVNRTSVMLSIDEFKELKMILAVFEIMIFFICSALCICIDSLMKHWT